MTTVNFQCGNCNNLMAVSAEFLGQQVRCPHCQAVVVAPAAAAPAEPGPTAVEFSPPANEQDDIFAPPEPTDDLFGRAEAPRVELPPALQEPALALNGDANAAPQVPVTPFGSTMTYAGPETAPSPSTGTGAIPSWMDSPPAPASAAPSIATEPTEETHEETIPHLIRRSRDGGGWFVGLVVIPLISYALLATVAVLLLWYRFQQAPPPPPNQLDILPSFDPNDEEHSTHLQLKQKALNRIRGMDVKMATGPLLPERITRLGGKLQVGDLEITPLKVDRQRVSVISKGSQPEPCRGPSLVLHLKLRNISSNIVFQPMDTFFNRKWMSKSEQPPLTILELVEAARTIRFFGGPAEYHPPPPPNNIHASLPQEVEGDHASHVLRPGEEMETFVCTDGDDKAAVDAVENHHGKLLWRVHLRRGVITLDSHHLVPVSSVVGVEFTDDDYRKSS
jgi:phage FluMu protein Com